MTPRTEFISKDNKKAKGKTSSSLRDLRAVYAVPHVGCRKLRVTEAPAALYDPVAATAAVGGRCEVPARRSGR